MRPCSRAGTFEFGTRTSRDVQRRRTQPRLPLQGEGIFTLCIIVRTDYVPKGFLVGFMAVPYAFQPALQLYAGRAVSVGGQN
jgi:hypothetical protein